MKFIKDLKKWYFILFESATILAILLVLLAFKYPTQKNEPITFPQDDFDTIEVEDIPITDPKKTPPKPPKPSIVIPVPDNKVIDEPIGDLDINWENGDNLPIPEEPKEFDEEKIFKVVEHDPQMKGGIQSLYNKITYPRQAQLAGIEGTVYIQFVVDKNGSVINATIVRGIGGGCNEAALEAVKKLKFTPGLQRGIPVKVQMKLPVVFDLK